MSKSLLSDWVSARRLPSLKNIDLVARLATHLGLTLEQLLVGDGEERRVITALNFEDEGRRYEVRVKRIK